MKLNLIGLFWNSKALEDGAVGNHSSFDYKMLLYLKLKVDTSLTASAVSLYSTGLPQHDPGHVERHLKI